MSEKYKLSFSETVKEDFPLDAYFPEALAEISLVLKEGSATHRHDEWRDGNRADLIYRHLSHAREHLIKVLACDLDTFEYGVFSSDIEKNDISHAATRCLMALQLLLED